jgi:adenylate cyclase
VQEITFREVDRVRVKGREEAITVFEPFAEVDAAAQEELRIWAQVLRAYRSRNWDLAEVNLVNLQRAAPGRKLYQVFAERLAEARRTPMTADWDPVTVFEDK